MDEQAALAQAVAGRYQIEREIGRGGMATVYVANDLKHDRRVAVKVLHGDLGAVVGADRFLSEIRVTANLHHPNLLPLFDSGEAAGLLYYVMPYVDGESLRTRLDRERQLPIESALRIAVGIGDALEYAHARGIVHRDLKPENILLQAGKPIVADFGIALAVSNAGGARVTQTGISLGTPQYMSPEQATGDRIIDARSDIFSLGAITYEMLVGEPPHTGSTSQAIMARLMTERPRAVRESRASVPEHVDDAVAVALEKLPADRFASAKEFADALEGRGSPLPTGRRTRALRSSSRSATPWIAASVLGVAALAAGAWGWRATHAAPPRPLPFVVEPPPGLTMGSVNQGLQVALSPDGQTLAYAAAGRLFVRRFGQLDDIAFPKTNPRGSEFHFSADGTWLLYTDGGPNKIRTGASNTGDEPFKVTPPTSRLQIAGTNASELFYLQFDALWRVPLAGGTPRRFAKMDTTQDDDWCRPTMLPDGKTIAFRVTPRGAHPCTGTSNCRLGLISIDDGPQAVRTVVDSLDVQSVIGYLDGALIFSRNSEGVRRLMAVKFDIGRRKLLGEPVSLGVDNVMMLDNGTAHAAVSETGTLAYLKAPAVTSTLETFDEHGVATQLLPGSRVYGQAVIAPDGKRIAVSISEKGQYDIYVYDPASTALTPLTRAGGFSPSWTRDGKRIVFIAAKTGNVEGAAMWVAADGSSAPEAIPAMSGFGPTFSGISVTPDGNYITGIRYVTLYAFPVAGGQPIQVGPISGGMIDNQGGAVVSPNGKWVAYPAYTTRWEIFVRPFPSGKGELPVSPDGGGLPRWWGDKLIYTHGNSYRVVKFDETGAMPRIVRVDSLPIDGRQFSIGSVHPDGKRFVGTRTVSGDVKLVVVTNWLTELREKLAGK
jgi:serine/threonine-protein kinase